MNNIYKVIYCKATQTFVAVSELAKGQGKSSVRSQRRAGSAFNGRLKLLSLSVLIGLGLSSQAMADCTNTTAARVICGNGATTATGNGAVAVGGGATAGSTGTNQSVALGQLASATGDQATAVGANANASGNSSIAIGGDDLDRVASTSVPLWNASVTEAEAIALNDTAAAQKYYELTGDWLVHYENNAFSTTANSNNPDRYQTTTAGAGAVAVGVSSTAADLATAFGTRATAEGIASVALGVGSHATMDNAVALGAGSTTDVNGTSQIGTNIIVNGVSQSYNWAGGTSIDKGDVVSVGAVGFERQVKNVAAGAVNANSRDYLLNCVTEFRLQIIS